MKLRVSSADLITRHVRTRRNTALALNTAMEENGKIVVAITAAKATLTWNSVLDVREIGDKYS